jgi:hypothetical protein
MGDRSATVSVCSHSLRACTSSRSTTTCFGASIPSRTPVAFDTEHFKGDIVTDDQRFVGDGGTRPSWPGVCDLDPHLPDGGWALQAWIRDYNIVSLHRA